MIYFSEYGCIEVKVNVYSDEEAGVLVESADLIMSDREYVVDPYFPWVSYTSCFSIIPAIFQYILFD